MYKNIFFLKISLLLALIVIMISLFSFNSFASRRDYNHINVYFSNVPNSSVYVDILVPELTDNRYYNSDKDDIDIFPTTAEIINYKDSDGFVSLTFNYDISYNYTDMLIKWYVYFSNEYKNDIDEKYYVHDEYPSSNNEVYISYSSIYRLYGDNPIKYNSLEYLELISSIQCEYREELYSSFSFDSNNAVNNTTFLKYFKYFKIAFLDENGNVLKTTNQCKVNDMEANKYKYICDGIELISEKQKSIWDDFDKVITVLVSIVICIFVLDVTFFICDIRYIHIFKKYYPADIEKNSLSILILINFLLWLFGLGLISVLYNISMFGRYRKKLKNKIIEESNN